jgi:glyoxylase-like metal-dependent hydrolase (beta-lactamase superfamily II)/8-oxo-dGTP pyrophosphatase MutT (NUDIX family)
MAFQGNYHAFPGGQREESDAAVAVRGGSGDATDAMRVAAVRELFEETGVLVARGVERLGRDELREMRRRMADERATFGELLAERGLEVDAALLGPAGRWVTPPFSPRRFDTWFFTAWLPDGQNVELCDGELDHGEWLRPAEAIAKWETGTLLVAPPILHAMRVLAAGMDDLEARFASIPEARGGHVRRIELRPGIILFPVRTPTQPPATHTNCYVVGGHELVVIDPASPYEDEQTALDELIDTLVRDEGRRVREIIATHLHPDHVGGIEHLANRLGVPVAAHPITARALEGTVRVDRLIEDGERIELEGPPDITLHAVHTPGHARGHLCFFEERNRALITGDLIVGLGTVVIDPPEGNMADYLASLARVRALEPTAIFGAHGPVVGTPIAKIDEYVAHRLEREAKIYAAVASGAATPAAIVAAVYTDVPEKLHRLAERSVLAHLEKLETDGRVTVDDGGRWSATPGG